MAVAGPGVCKAHICRHDPRLSACNVKDCEPCCMMSPPYSSPRPSRNKPPGPLMAPAGLVPSSVPTMSEWGLIVMSSVMALFAFGMRRRLPF